MTSGGRTLRGSAGALLATILLGGCTTLADIAQQVQPTPAAPATARPTVPAATVAPTSAAVATPSPAANPVVDAFLAGFAQKQPPFHIDCRVEVNGSAGKQSESASLTMSGDVSGENFAGQMTLQHKRVLVRIVDGRAYARLPSGGDWRSEAYRQTQPLNPMAGLSPGDLEWLGKKTVGGRKLDVLRTTKWIGNDINSTGFANAKLESTQLDMYVEKDGTPVQAILDFTISGKSYGEDARYTAHVVYKFSDVGKAVEITAPG
jgi:hypothetical protein